MHMCTDCFVSHMVVDTYHGRWSNHIQRHLLLLLLLSILCTIRRCLSCIIMVWPHETKLGLDKQVIMLNIFKCFDEYVDICDQACKNRAYLHIKFGLFFDLQLAITFTMLKLSGRNFYAILINQLESR